MSIRLSFQLLIAASTLLTGVVAESHSLHWESHDGYRSAALVLPFDHPSGFHSVSGSDSGVAFTNRLTGSQIAANRLMEDGSGVALGDVDGDGRCDIYLCSLSGANALYRNLGDWKFENITASAGVGCPGQSSTGAVLADVDGDGDLDLLVNALGGGTRLFINDGSGHFREPDDSGLIRQGGSHSLALADVDGDGNLDLFVANYRGATAKDSPVKVKVRQVNGRWEVPIANREQFLIESSGPGSMALLEVGETGSLYLGDGHGHFAAQSWTNRHFLDEEGRALSEPPRDWSLSAMFRDLNGDGLPDLYVCNDYFTPDRLWLNEGKGVFRLAPRLALRKTSWAAMAVDVADLDRDGYDEIFVTEMLSRSSVHRKTQHSLLEIGALPRWGWGWDFRDSTARIQVMRNTLSWNRGDGTFAEMAQRGGVDASEWSWGCLFLDVDLDGYEDLLIANGHSRDLANSDSLAEMDRQPPPADAAAREKTLSIFPPMPLAHLAFRNRGNLNFEDRSEVWGFGVVSAANGMAMGDLDNDGDLDVVVNNLNGEASVLRNEGSGGRVAVRLKGRGGNTQGIGARIVLKGAPVEQSQEMISGGRYLSGAEAQRVFASMGASNMTLEVRWRSGKRSVVRGVEANHVYEVEEPEGETRVESRKDGSVRSMPEVTGATMFEEVSVRLGHEHHEEAYDDFSRQPLLPHRLSQLGPGVGWFDLNGDGKDDLIIGSGRGGKLRVYAGDGNGGFRALRAPALEEVLEEDQSGVVAWSAEAGSANVLVGEGNYERVGAAGPSARGYNVFFGELRPVEGIAGSESSTGPLALGDVDGDGDLDLFVGGRMLAGRYPAAASSRLYRSEGGQWVLDEANTRRLSGLGLVNGAVWSDLDGDGYPELVVACEWGPVHVFGNQAGELKEMTEAWGLSGYRGWWTGVSAGDFDGDGRMDLVVGNWGRNTGYEENLGGELRVYHGDIDGNGSWDIIEAQWDRALKKVVPRRDWKTMGQAIPMVQERFHNYRDYASAGLDEIFGAALGKMEELRVNTLDSMVFLNRGGKFEGRPLPMEAQLAPVFGVCVGDYDGDGREDIFLGQNFFGTDRETGRYDAGRGLWLKGNGEGGWRAVPGQESGVKVYGEQRGAALSDYDRDGRVDLVVSQNASATQLYHNIGGRPGLRVRLVGPAGNLSGLGALLRLGPAGKPGPARELHGGGGYWSQDSSIPVLALSETAEPLVLSVVWPGGRKFQFPVPPATHEIEVSADGSSKVVR